MATPILSSINPNVLCDDDIALQALLDDLNPAKTPGSNTSATSFDLLKGRAGRAHGLLQERGVVDGGTVEWTDEGDVGRWAVGVLEGLIRAGVGLGGIDNRSIGLGLGNAVKGVRGLRERLERAESEIERREREVEGLKEKLRRKDGKLWELERYVEEVRDKGDERKRKDVKEIGALRMKMKKLEKREGVLVGEKERANKEIAVLKRKLQDVMKKGGRRPGIRMTGKIRRWEEEAEGESGAEEGLSFYEMVSSNYEESKRELMAENDDFRNLLRSAQEELDDIIVQCHSVSSPGEDTDLPEQAPDASRMQLPYEMIREEFETSLEAKFNLIRKCLNRMYSAQAQGAAEGAVRSHIADTGTPHAQEDETTPTSAENSYKAYELRVKDLPSPGVENQGSGVGIDPKKRFETSILHEKYEQFGPPDPPKKILQL